MDMNMILIGVAIGLTIGYFVLMYKLYGAPIDQAILPFIMTAGIFVCLSQVNFDAPEQMFDVSVTSPDVKDTESVVWQNTGTTPDGNHMTILPGTTQYGVSGVTSITADTEDGLEFNFDGDGFITTAYVPWEDVGTITITPRR